MKPDTYMLWQLNSTELPKEVKKAIEHYRNKYGNPPSVLLLNPQWKESELPDDLNIVIKAYRPILMNLVWIGEE